MNEEKVIDNQSGFFFLTRRDAICTCITWVAAAVSKRLLQTLCGTLMSMTLVGHPCTTLSQANLLSQYSVAGGQTFILGSLGTTFVVLYMIPSPAHETPLEWVGSPRNTPLPCILLVFGASWHIHPCNAHTKVKFPTYDRFLHTHTQIYIYI